MTRTERAYYVVTAAYSVPMLIVPVYPLFLLSRGLDLFQCHLVLATFLICSSLFEVPTGVLADVAGRKLSFLLSCIIRAFAFGLYALANGFVDCLVAEMIDAVGQTLASGALDAWAVDGMRAEGSRRPVDRFFARAQMISRGVMIVAGIGGGYVAEYSYSLAWLLGAGGFASAAVMAAVVMKEPARSREGTRVSMYRSLGTKTWEALITVREVPVLRVLCLATLAIAFAMMPSHMLWQPTIQGLTGAGTGLMGWVWALWNVAIIAGSTLISYLPPRLRRGYVLCIATLWRAVMFVLVSVATTFWPALAGIVLAEVGFAVSEPLLQAWMNEHTPSARRAAVLSVRAMAFTLGGSIGLACVGLVARDVSINAAWALCAAVFVLAAPAFILLGRVVRQTAETVVAPPVAVAKVGQGR